jgi:hypothetical protein
MIGVTELEERLATMGEIATSSWLENGLRLVAGRITSEKVELAFAPLLLAPSEPPMEQFHSAVERLPDELGAHLRRACGLLLGSIREHDSPLYLRELWALAASFRPPGGSISAARRMLDMIRKTSLASDVTTPAIVDSMVATPSGL